MNSPPKVLIVAYHFPPDAEVGTQRVTRFCRYLPACGFRPVVLTVEERFCAMKDASLQVPPGIRVERTSAPRNPVEWYRRWKARNILPSHFGGGSDPPADREWRPGSLRRHALALLKTADLYWNWFHWGWYLPALRRAQDLLKQEPIAAVFSTGPPWSSHLVARHLKRKFNLPWLADFRDPWSCRVHRPIPGWLQRLDNHLEAGCVSGADYVICNTERLRQKMVELYPTLPSAKFVTLTNRFDDPVGQQTSLQSGASPRLVLHLGSLYGGRRIDTFCQAIVKLMRAGRLDGASFRILFLGNVDPDLKAAAQRAAPEIVRSHWIEFQPRVSWQRASNALQSADLFLLFSDDHFQVLAKFYEYFQTGKPMFAVTPEGALTDVLQSTGAGLWAAPENPAEIAERFLSALDLPSRPQEDIIERWSHQYHFRYLTQRLAGFISSSIEARSVPTRDTPLCLHGDADFQSTTARSESI